MRLRRIRHPIGVTLTYVMALLGIGSWILGVSIVAISLHVGAMLIMVKDYVSLIIQMVLDTLHKYIGNLIQKKR